MFNRDQNIVIVHPVKGVVYCSGDICEHMKFLDDMILKAKIDPITLKEVYPYRNIASFSGNFTIEKICSPLIVYRSGDIGKYWTTNLPLSPLQQTLDLAMHPSLYPIEKLETSYGLPVNKCVLIYQIPEGTIIARGLTAPQSGYPGMKEQIFLHKVNPMNVKEISWVNWKSYGYKFCSSYKMLTNQPMTTIPWRSAFSAPRKVPFYLRFNYSNLGKMALPPLLCWDIYSRTKKELLLHSDHSALANARAVSTNFTLDILPAIYLVPKIGAGFASAAIISVEVLSEVADKIRHVPAEAMENNRDLFMVAIHGMDLSPELEYKFLQDFDEGKQWTREFNISNAKFIKTVFKPFEWIHDGKKWIVDTIRGDKSEPIKNIEKKVEALTEKDIRLSEIFHSVDPIPSTLQPAPQMPFNLNEIDFLDNQNGMMIFNVPVNSGVLDRNLHSFLSDPALSSPVKSEIEQRMADRILRIGLTPDRSRNEAPHSNDKQPFIKNIAIGPVGGGIGIIATLGSNGIVSVTAGKGSFLVSVSAEFGAGFWSALGSATLVGAIVAGVLIAVQSFYNRHLKHIQHKIKKAIKLSTAEGKSISESLKQLSLKLQQEMKINYSELIGETNNLIQQIMDKINKEKDRAKYANKRKQFKARNAHHDLMRNYHDQTCDLSHLGESLSHEEMNDKFIHDNRDKSTIEIIKLAKDMTSKKLDSDTDVAKIRALRQLIITKAVNLTTSGKTDEAITLLSETLTLQYYLPGDISELLFGEGWGKLSKGTSNDVNIINEKIIEINRLIGSGENPIPALQNLIKIIQEKTNKWKHLKLDRREISRSSEYYVTKQQWEKRIEVLTTLIETLKTKIQQHENGNRPENLNLGGISDLLHQLLSCTSKSASFWITELQSIKSGENKLTKEQSIIFTEIASHYLMGMVMNHIAQGNVDDAIHILDNLKTLIPEYADLSPKYINKLNELKEFFKEKPAFWINRIKNINVTPQENRNEGDEFELIIAEQFITNDVFSLALSGEFEDANKILDDYKNIMSEPEQSDKINAYRDGIKELEILHKSGNQKLLQRYSEIINLGDQAPDELNAAQKNAIVLSGLKSWILQNVFELVSTGKANDAKADLAELQILDKQHNDLYVQLIDVISNGELNSDKDLNFWLNAYKDAQPTNDPANFDAHDKTINNMKRVVAINAVLNKAVKRSQLGFNREAAEIIQELISIDPDLKLNDIEEDFAFAHQGQIINIFTKPLQSMLTRYIASRQPSYARSTALGGLDLLNTAQIIIPNFLTLIAQKAHAHCVTHNVCGIDRNIGYVKSQLSKDINPFDKDFNPFHRDSYCNGLMIYGQLFLKAVQYFPLAKVMPEKYLYTAENIRMNMLHYGHLTTRATFSGIAALQLKSAFNLEGGIFSPAYTPLTLVTLASSALDLSYYQYHQYKISRGEAIEDYQHYLTQDKINSGLDTVGAVAFAMMITGGLGWIPLTVGVVTGGSGLYNVCSESAKKEATVKALVAAIQNINYFRNNKLESSDAAIISRNNIANLLLSTFNGLAYDKDQPEAINVARIVHLYETLMDNQLNKDYQNILYWSAKHEHKGNIVISKEYQLPPYLAWQIIVGIRLLAYAESMELLSQFREQFQEYSQLIYNSANESKPWYHANWNKVQKYMKKVLQYALQQFIVAANNARTDEDKLSYLNYITQHYNYNKEWYKLLKNDELKFWAACLYHNLGKIEECKLFLQHIEDLRGLIISKKQADFTEQALIMLENIDAELHKNIILESRTGDILISDTTLFNIIFKLVTDEKIHEANQFLQELGEFKGKYTLLAYCKYELSNKTDILETLKLLFHEDTKSRNLIFWHLLYNILKSCLSSFMDSSNNACDYDNNQNNPYVKLFGLLKLCADNIQTFKISFELKTETDHTIHLAISYIKNYLKRTHCFFSSPEAQINSEIDRLIEWGHKCMRGENDIDVISEIKNMLQSISHEYPDGEIKSKYLSIKITSEDTRLVKLPTQIQEVIEKPETPETDKYETKSVLKPRSSHQDMSMFNNNANVIDTEQRRKSIISPFRECRKREKNHV